MHHLSSLLSTNNMHGVRVSIKQMSTDLSLNKRGHARQCNKKNYSINRHAESPFGLTSNLQSCIILAIVTGRGKLKHEVGLALLDLYYPHLTLCQISDCYVYSNTLAKINIHQPDEIIMPEVYINNINTELCLQRIITSKFNKVHITYVSSLHFSALVGWDLIDIYCTNESSSVKQIIKHKHYALSAASALLKYTMYIQRMTFAPKTVKVEFKISNDSITLDIETVELLEIVCSLNEALPNFNLYNALNKCVTPLGRKLLRTSLLQPLHNETCIDKRIQCVCELVTNNSLHRILQLSLKKMYRVEQLLSISFKRNKCDNIHQAQKNLNYILLLKKIMDIIPEFQTIFKNTSSLFFNPIKINFEDTAFNEIKNLIFELIQIDASSFRGYTSSNMQRCFAIKPKVSELLDIIRQAYCELIDKMIQYTEYLSQKYCLQLTLGCNSSSGYYIQMNLSRKLKYNTLILPNNFIILKQKKNTLFMTTEKLMVDSEKCKEINEEIHIMSNVIIENLIDKIQAYTDKFFQLCTDIGKLDFIMCLAIVSKIRGFVQPAFGQKLCFIDSYHPIQFLVGLQTGISNNIVASVPYNFQIITGPNLSGKTTYLKQIVLLHILAQIGCFIPAQEATLRICDRFFFHTSNYYITKNSMSLYEYEMNRLSYIINFLTDYSLVTLDEPCMRTATQEGTCLAVSICIKILNTHAFCFCATHQYYLTRIAETFLNVTNLYFDCYQRTADDFTLIYTHQIKIGITTISHYGLSMAKLSNFSESIISKAKIIAQKLFLTQKESHIFRRNTTLELLEKYYSLIAKLYNLFKNKQFTIVAVSFLLKQYFSSEFIHFVQKNFHFIPKLSNKSVILKKFFKNDDKLINNNKSILMQLLMISNNLYITDVFNLKRYKNYLNVINSNNLKDSELLLKLTDFDDLSIMNVTRNSSVNLKFISSKILSDEYNKIRKNTFYETHLSSMEENNFSSKRVQIHVKKEQINNISFEHKKFNVDSFYKHLLDINLSLCES